MASEFLQSGVSGDLEAAGIFLPVVEAPVQAEETADDGQTQDVEPVEQPHDEEHPSYPYHRSLELWRTDLLRPATADVTVELNGEQDVCSPCQTS